MGFSLACMGVYGCQFVCLSASAKFEIYSDSAIMFFNVFLIILGIIWVFFTLYGCIFVCFSASATFNSYSDNAKGII